MYELGGHAVYLAAQGSQIGRGEPLRDTARVLGALLPRHRHPHLRPRRRRGAGALRAGAGHQRPHRSVAPVPGAGRSVHRRGSGSAPARSSRAARASPGLATATTWRTRGSRRPPSSGSISRSPAPRATIPTPTCWRARASDGDWRAHIEVVRTPDRGGARAPRACRPTSGRRWARRREQARARESVRRLLRRRRAPAARRARRDGAALPARAPRRGDHRRRARRPALGACSTQAENRLHVQKAILERLLADE